MLAVALLLLGLAVLERPPAARAAKDSPEQPGAAPLEVLLQALQDDNALVRKRAAIALGELGPGGTDAIPALTKALKDDDAAVRAAADAALEKLGAPPSLATLLARLRDRKAEGEVRTEACRQLAERFGQEPEVRKTLEGLLTDPEVKVAAAQTLEKAPHGQEILSLKGHTDTVTSVCFSPDGKRLASASVDGTVRLWGLDQAPGKAPPK